VVGGERRGERALAAPCESRSISASEILSEGDVGDATEQDAAIATEIAERSLVLVGRERAACGLPIARGAQVTLVLLSGDPGPAGAGAGAELAALVLARAPDARVFPVGPDSPDERLAAVSGRTEGPLVVAVFSRIAAWKGGAGLPPREAVLLDRLVKEAGGAAIVASFGSPYLLGRCTGAGARVAAWSDEAVSQRAFARALFGEIPFAGRLPVSEARTEGRG
jgi:beta-N-acetylhexosaminidase